MSFHKAVIGTVVALTIIFTGTASADHKEEVLGEATKAEVVFPPVAAGPGYILPDSPLYALDKVFQEIRIAIAITPERRAAIRELIMQERLAEARVMHSRGKQEALDASLDGIVAEAAGAAKDLKDAAAQGKDVAALAKEINDTIKYNREVLKTVEEQAPELLALQVATTRHGLLVAKTNVEDQLSYADLENEVNGDLEEAFDTEVLGVETATKKLESRIDKLERRASKAAEIEAQKAIIQQKKQTLKTQKEILQQQLKVRKQRLMEERKKKAQEAKEAAKKAREAAKRLKEARKAELKLITEPSVSPGLSPEVEDESSRSLNSGSGSTSSGSSNSGSGSSGSNSGSGSSNSGSGSNKQ